MLTQLCILLLLLLPSGILLTRHLKNHHHPRTRRKTAVVLVLGDIGRSPRMMYHAQSLVRSGFKVWLVGYSGTPPLSSLQSSPDVSIHYIPPPPDFLNTIRLPFLVGGPAKVIFQVIGMLKILLRYPTALGAEFLLVQNPPAIPTLLLAQVISFVRGSKLVIDWHNTGYSILALKLGNGHLLVKLARWFEKTFGRTAYAHLFVTDAMQITLSKNWELHWTPDEDFTVLVSALDEYQRLLTSPPPSANHPGALPALLVLVSGKGGPLLSSFLSTVSAREKTHQWPDITVRTTWLAMSDYPVFLGSADLGETLQGFPHAPKLQMLRDYFAPSDGRDGRDGRRQAWSSWDEQWVRVVGPVLSKKDQ
ncbi:hypothetical protein QFC21_003451 [Naganishia friedmannii]|uniref:Uncharacterized protein n=1 Tax=Naganishia friedmannii TaxID=89922 RepID=A0ACC2VQP1_9TREE|nr:hypothetical protein QFC21_003451 [Naganishia friedmannii]